MPHIAGTPDDDLRCVVGTRIVDDGLADAICRQQRGLRTELRRERQVGIKLLANVLTWRPSPASARR